MSENTDYAAQALKKLAKHPVGKAVDGAWGTAIATEAQAYATLELATQLKRIADVLELGGHNAA